MTNAAEATVNPSDAELVERCRAGESDAWGLLVERYSRYVYAIAVRGFRLPEQEAEDVFQDVFLRIYERLGSIRDEGALRPWIAQVARRVCLDRLAAARSAPEQAELDEAAGVAAISDLDEALAVHEALRQLDERCRELLDRFFARDEPYRVIADALDLPMGTVASRISRCLDRLRELFTGDGRNAGPSPSGEASR